MFEEVLAAEPLAAEAAAPAAEDDAAPLLFPALFPALLFANEHGSTQTSI